MDNRTIAERLTEGAHLLEAERGNLYRVMAYRRAAETILGLDEPVEDIVRRDGRRGLKTLPGIGSHLSHAIENLVLTGDFRTSREENRSAPKRKR
jgi:DNA polymerase (family 10)